MELQIDGFSTREEERTKRGHYKKQNNNKKENKNGNDNDNDGGKLNDSK